MASTGAETIDSRVVRIIWMVTTLRLLIKISTGKMNGMFTSGTKLLRSIGCCRRLPVIIVLKPANSAPGGKASLVIGSRKNVSKLERNAPPTFPTAPCI